MKTSTEVTSAPSLLRTLTRAIKEAIEEVSAGFATAREHPELASSIVQNGRFIPALERILELAGWLRWETRRRPKMSRKETANFATFMVEKGVDPTMAIKLANAGRKRGAPIRKRRAAVLAWEIKLARPATTWNALAAQFCDCGSAHHEFKCQDRLRREVGHLKRVLKKHHITLI